MPTHHAYNEALRQRDKAVAEVVRLIEGIRACVAKCGRCYGNREYERDCDLCNDSTHDHICVTPLLPCMACADLRALLPSVSDNTKAIRPPKACCLPGNTCPECGGGA